MKKHNFNMLIEEGWDNSIHRQSSSIMDKLQTFFLEQTFNDQ